MVNLIIAICMAMAYAGLLLYYRKHWLTIPETYRPEDTSGLPRVSVVIVAHNEGRNIERTLNGILRQQYPSDKFEVLVIDDHSTDETASIVRQIEHPGLKFFVLRDYPDYIQAPAYKKSAIALAVDLAQHENIVVTDADCYHPPGWLATVMHHFTEHKAVFQTAPVLPGAGPGHIHHTWLPMMQELEGLMLIGITGAGIQSGLHDLANGANMAFTLTAFREVGGYADNTHIASGDDLFLAEKMRRAYPDGVTFVKSADAAVQTDVKHNWDDLLRQRRRWAGKNKSLQHKTISRIWMFVGIYHIAALFFGLQAILLVHPAWPFWIMLMVKLAADYALLDPVATYFRRTHLLSMYVPLQFQYAWYLFRLGISMLTGQKGDWRS
jgi:biofilm PGA synthesis N-glycosyltransferase PgaC